MASSSSSSSSIPKSSTYHTRSVSLPPRPHPLIPYIDEHLCRLRSSHEPTSLSAITDKLRENLYGCMESLLMLPLSQQALIKSPNQKWANEVADGYLLLLKVCGVAKDALLQTKEYVQELQSTLRRRPCTTHGAAEYLASGKKVKKMIEKSLRDLIKSKKTLSNSSISENEQETGALFCLSRKVETRRFIEKLMCLYF